MSAVALLVREKEVAVACPWDLEQPRPRSPHVLAAVLCLSYPPSTKDKQPWSREFFSS